MADPTPPAPLRAFIYQGTNQAFPLTIAGELKDIQLVQGQPVELPEDAEFIPAWLDLGLLKEPPAPEGPSEPGPPAPAGGEPPPPPPAPDGDPPPPDQPEADGAKGKKAKK